MRLNTICRFVLLTCLFVTPLLFVPVIKEQFETPKLFLIWVTVSLLISRVSFKGLKYDPIGIGLLAFLFSTMISALTSMSFRTSILGVPQCPNGVCTTLGYVMLYFAAKALLKNHKHVSTAIRALLLAGVISCLYAMAQYNGYDIIMWKGELSKYASLRPASTMGHPNFLAAFIAMLIPSVSFIRINWLKGAVFTLFCIVIILAQSRGAWISVSVTCLLWLCFNGLKKHLAAGLVALGCVAPFISGFIANHLLDSETSPFLFSLTSRLASVFQFNGARLEYLKTAWRIFKEHPLFGSGTDTFQLAFEHHRSAAYWIMEPGGAPHRAHNEFMNIAATQGVIGIFSLGILFYGISSRLYRRSLYSLGKRERALVLTIISFLITSLFGFPVAVTALTFIIALASIFSLTESYVR